MTIEFKIMLLETRMSIENIKEEFCWGTHKTESTLVHLYSNLTDKSYVEDISHKKNELTESFVEIIVADPDELVGLAGPGLHLQHHATGPG